MTKAASGGRAIQRAVTRVKPEQASKVEMRMSTRLQNGEGRTDGEEIDRGTRPIRRGSWARHAGKVMRVTGETRPVGGRGFTVAGGGGSDGSRTGAQYC